MNRMVRVTTSLLVAMLWCGAAAAQHRGMPPGMTHEEHLTKMQTDAEMNRRGAIAMGFDQHRTTHHFRLTAEGGIILVDVKDPADTTNRDAICAHLRAISEEFARGDFSKPFITHDETPAGVQTLRRLKSAITFRFEETERGGRVRMTTNDADALKAIHDFLRYQIAEHATGDSLTILGR